MHVPPDPKTRPVQEKITWRSILAIYAMLATIPIVLWAVSRPLVSTGVFTAVVGASIAVRRARGLVRCFRECQGFAFDLGGTVRITVTQTPTDD